MTEIHGRGGGVRRPDDWCGTPLPQKTRFQQIRDLVRAHKEDVNTNNQLDTVNKIWDLMQPEIVAEYIAPWDPVDPGPVLRYLVPRPPTNPGDDIVAEYIAVAPRDLPAGYDPNDYAGRSGAEVADVVSGRDHPDPTDTNGRRFPDDMVMFYLVAPPPPDPEQQARFNQLRKFDLDMNKTFKGLMDVAHRIVRDNKVSQKELDEFSRLHFSFELCGKLFYDGLREYQKDFPLHPSPEEYGRVTGFDPGLRAPTGDAPRDPDASPLGVRIGSMTSGDDE